MHQPDLLAVGLHTSHNKGSTRGFKLSSTKPSSEKVCHVEEHAEYEGAEVIKWGAENMQVGAILAGYEDRCAHLAIMQAWQGFHSSSWLHNQLDLV